MLYLFLLVFVIYIATAQTLSSILKPSRLLTTAKDVLAVDSLMSPQQSARSDGLSQEEVIEVLQCLERSANGLKQCRIEVNKRNRKCPLEAIHKIWEFIFGRSGGGAALQDRAKTPMKARIFDELTFFYKLFSTSCECIKAYSHCCTDVLCTECETTVAENLPAYMNTTHWVVYKASAACGGILAGLPCRDDPFEPGPSTPGIAIGIVFILLFVLITAGLVYVFVVKKDGQQQLQPKSPGQMPPGAWSIKAAPASKWSSASTSTQTSSMFSGPSSNWSKTVPSTFRATTSNNNRSRTPGKSSRLPKSAHRKRSPYFDERRNKSSMQPKQSSNSCVSFNLKSSQTKQSRSNSTGVLLSKSVATSTS